MQIANSFKEIKSLRKPIAITIGMFDGMHLGHQKIFSSLKELTYKQSGTVIAITFANHPIEHIKPGTFVPKISSLEEKLKLFKENGAHIALLLKFTDEIKNLSYDQFLKLIKTHIDFNYLVLGEDATFGKNNEGTQENVLKISKTLGFEAIYLKLSQLGETSITSRRVRETLKQGHVEKIPELLGRPYSLFAPFQIDKLKEAGENLMKITFNFDNHCLIPSGKYLVSLSCNSHNTQALAHLTTLNQEKESKTFDLEIFLQGSMAEYLNDNIRIEFIKRMDSRDEVKDDITHNGKIEKLNIDETSL